MRSLRSLEQKSFLNPNSPSRARDSSHQYQLVGSASWLSKRVLQSKHTSLQILQTQMSLFAQARHPASWKTPLDQRLPLSLPPLDQKYFVGAPWVRSFEQLESRVPRIRQQFSTVPRKMLQRSPTSIQLISSCHQLPHMLQHRVPFRACAIRSSISPNAQ